MPCQAVFFLIDTQGTNCVGCYAGNRALGTPNIDGLAEQGIRYERAYTCSPVCGPARSAIFTGLYPHSNGVVTNGLAPHLDIPTLGQRLTQAGIPIACIGKWHLDGLDYFGNGQCPDGWNPKYWFDGLNYLESLPDERARSLSREMLGSEEISRHGITAEFTHAHRTADRALQFLEEHRDEDFFLVVSIDEPHDPYICPEPFISRFTDFLLPVPNADDSLEDKPAHQRDWASQTQLEGKLIRQEQETSYQNPAYFGCNSFSDSEVGRVLGGIDRFTPAALVVYTADHGDLFGSHGLTGKGPVMYEEIVHIPLIVRWPGKASEGIKRKNLVSHIDLAPTFLDFFGIPIPDLLQGRSLLSQFRSAEVAADHPVFLEFHRFAINHDGYGAFYPVRCMVDGPTKLIVNLLETDELYDLDSDPGELVNRIFDPALASRRDELHSGLLAWMDATRDPLRGPHWKRRVWNDGGGSAWMGPSRERAHDHAFSVPARNYVTGKPRLAK